MRQETSPVSWLLRAVSALFALGIGCIVFNLCIAATWTLITAGNHPSVKLAETFGQIFLHPTGWALLGYSLAVLFVPTLGAFWLVLRSSSPRLRNFVFAGIGVAALPLLIIGPFWAIGSFIVIYFGPAALVAGAFGGAGAWRLLRWTGNIPQQDHDEFSGVEPW